MRAIDVAVQGAPIPKILRISRGWTVGGRAPIVRALPVCLEFPNVLKNIFTWWNGATIGVRNTVRGGVFIGKDELGNSYYEAKDDRTSYDKGRKRRWVIYNGYAEASKVPADWHGWLHYTFDEPPTKAPLKRQPWEKDHLPNLTGTVHAWKPQGSIARGGERQKASGDYEAWRPE
ncbi:MAG: NADH:ubiquinone oxidoreductase subunit NDUFA12 [Phenylobacterium sp.]|nr:NADH:ubiquinone oxidoreductase subunit NDUFA12 [Phenylobacterium sp.]